MTKKTNSEKIGMIKAYKDSGLTYREIAIKCNVSTGLVSKILISDQNEPIVDMRGRPSKVGRHLVGIILMLRRDNPFLSLRKYVIEIEKSQHLKLAPNTIRQTLNDFGYKAHNPLHKPALKPEHKVSRVEMAMYFIGLGIEAHKQIIFTDETKINLLYNDNKPFVWRGDGEGLLDEHLIKTVKFGGGSIVLWGCFSYHGVGRIKIIDGIMDSVEYIDIISNYLLPSAADMGLTDFYLLHDNDPKHR
jgi:transposase